MLLAKSFIVSDNFNCLRHHNKKPIIKIQVYHLYTYIKLFVLSILLMRHKIIITIVILTSIYKE